MKRKYKLAKAAYSKGRYKLVVKIAQAASFDLDYENSQGQRKTIKVDPSTYHRTRSSGYGSVIASAMRSRYSGRSRRITISDQRIRNLPAFHAAIQAAGGSLQTAAQKAAASAQQRHAARQARQHQITQTTSQPPAPGVTRFEYDSMNGTRIIDLETNSINRARYIEGTGYPTGNFFNLDPQKVRKETVGTAQSTTAPKSTPAPTPGAQVIPLKCQKGEHEWVNAGTTKTWCKHCPAEGYWDMGKVVNVKDKLSKSSMNKNKKKAKS